MSKVVEEMMSYYTGADSDSEALEHYGTKFHSGRYPYGSGEDPYQHGGDFLSRVEALRKDGWKETAENVKKEFGLTLEEYRNEKAWANFTRRELNVSRAKSLKDQGMGPSEIGREMGVTESTVRSWLNPKSEDNMMAAKKTAEFLKKQVDEKGMIDVGTNVEIDLNVSRTKLDQALYALESEGYVVHKGRVEQVTNRGNWTTQMVLCPPGTPWKEIYNFDKIHTLNDYISHDNGETFDTYQYPKSLDSKRLMVRYRDDLDADGISGIEKDGIIELRRNVADLSLGEQKYSQVRILVDDTHYLKGMAVYSDNLPDGVDIVFNTNKSKDVPALGPNKNNSVLKPIKRDADGNPEENPFGSTIKKNGQSYYFDENGERQMSLINKKSEQGDWSDWQDALPSQFLSKQSKFMAKKQLDLAAADKMDEYESICALENPTIKKHLLKSFADDCDGAAVNLKAAALPGQKYHVIIPINTLKDTEIYAPRYENGTKLALVRYPHGGTFEIPVLTVNNKNKLGKSILGTDIDDAVGITAKVAEQLSGADFDGDTVMCIPTDDRAGKVKISRREPLKKLVGFDPKTEYPYEEGMKVMDSKGTQMQMGIISNLITDMTLSGGATDDELARAVRHSMVVIDAEKHKLNYKKSEIDNGISALVQKYQRTINPETGEIKVGGASTIISKAKSQERVDKRRGSPVIDPETGKQTYKLANADDLYYVDSSYNKKTKTKTVTMDNGKKVTFDMTDDEAREKYDPVRTIDKETGTVTYTNKAGDITYRTLTRQQISTKMAEADDAYELVSAYRHPMEIIYADYANSMKALANQARKEMMATGKLEYDPVAKNTYKAEVESLNTKLNDALKNSVKERQAQRLANAEVKKKKAENENLENKEIKKLSQQALSKYRDEVGSISRRDRNIDITDREWEAIQAGAIHESTLVKILNNTDVDTLRQRATPRATTTLNQAKINRIQSMSASNYTVAQIAEKLNLPASTVSKYLKGANN
jgi:DNA-binding NarL/FixJ family response regulator